MRLSKVFIAVAALCFVSLSAFGNAPDSSVSILDSMMNHGRDSGIGPAVFFENLDSHWDAFINWPGWEWWRLLFLLCGIVIGYLLRNIVNLVMIKVFGHAFRQFNHEILAIVCKTLASPLGWVVFALCVYLGGLPLTSVTESVYLFYWNCFIASLGLIGALFLYGLSDMAAKLILLNAQKKNAHTNPVLMMLMSAAVKAVIIVVFVLFLGDQFGVKIGALLAGAGVIGLAIAFAAQDTIANVFGSVMVILDKPFNVGDAVKIDGNEGTVIATGLRSTRIRNLDGHIITMPNRVCASASITNVSRRRFMRYVVDFGLIYETPPEKVKRAVELLLEIVNGLPGTHPSNPPSAGFFSYGASSINIRLIAFFHSLDENGNAGAVVGGDYFKWINALNQEIFERFNAEGLSFAYPTTVSYNAVMPGSDPVVIHKHDLS